MATITSPRVTKASVCPLDCPDTCNLHVVVERDRIVEIRGSRANPYTAGVLCAKVPAAYPEFVHGPTRLRTPLRRAGRKGEGRFERISWDEALDVVHERFTAIAAEHGPQAILPLNYGGPCTISTHRVVTVGRDRDGIRERVAVPPLRRCPRL